MEQFVVSARKYRPATFDSVVGQRSITTTLQNAIKNNHLAQAFLFCGPRGVGKTTCARILAREINITDGAEISDFSFNVFELDAASNNSVDDIRQLIDQVRIPPQTGKYKVYIIDEVHMLSAAAFNAFLKTLEEPPAHAIFILATTEKHKILPTILSRCQIFDFQRITVEAMAEHLQSIATKEQITAEPDALHVIAQKADGGLRDALSIFDQVVSFCGNNLTYQDVITNLNILDHDYYFSITSHIIQGNIPAAMLTLNEVLSKGFDGHNFINGLASHFRNLLVASDPGTLVLLEAGQSIRERYREQAASTPLPFLTRGLDLLSKADIQYKSSKQPRLLVEITLMQLCSLNNPAYESEKKNDQPLIISSATAPARKVSQPAHIPAPPQKTTEPAPGHPTQPATYKPEETISSPGIPTSSPVVTSEPKEISSPASREPVSAATLIRSVSEPIAPLTNLPTRRRGISIREITQTATLGPDNSEEGGNKPVSGPENEFSQDELKRAWDQYVEKAKNDGKAQLAITLTMRAFQVKEMTKIQLELDNAMQEELLRNEQADLLEHLRHNLKNFRISLETSVSPDTAVRKPYTTREKFLYLAEKYPELNVLRQQLGLDID